MTNEFAVTSGSTATAIPGGIDPTQKKKSSKAWIAGAVIGPIVGLALIGALVWFLLRRRNRSTHTAPQQGGAAMATADPSHPPAGVGGFTDAKPQFAQQQQAQPFVPAPYNNQSAYAQQQGFAEAPLSPAPQYNAAGTPYVAPGSPPPQQQYAQDVKHSHVATRDGAAELSGGTSSVVQSGHVTSSHQAAELSGGPTHQGEGLFGGPSELGTSHNTVK
jgi:hypothetical protein